MTLEQIISSIQGTGKPSYLKKQISTLLEMQQAKTVNIPFVVVAMTRTEAEELLTEKADVFDNTKNNNITGSQVTRFQNFKKAFDHEFDTTAKRNDWLTHYGKTREEWKPHIYRGTSKKAIVELIEDIAITHHERFTEKFWPDFVNTPENLFAKNDSDRRDAWNTLKRGYVLAIDSLSLFHPHIRATVKNFAIKGKQAALLIFSQCHAFIPAIDELIEEELDEEIPWAFDKFNKSFDGLYEIGVNQPRKVHRWLAASMPILVKRQKEPLPEPENRWPGPIHGAAPGGPYS